MRTWFVTFFAMALVGFAACSGDDDPAPIATADAAAEASGGNDSGPATDASGSEAAATQDSGALKPFGETCSGDAECQSNACFVGGNQSFCSIKCTKATQATDCPKPPTGGDCNNQGFCRKP